MSTVAEYTANGKETYARNEAWEEVLAPALFNFEKIGDRIDGVLLDLRVEKIDNRDVVTARLEAFEGMSKGTPIPMGTQIKFRPQFDLRQKIGKRLLGRRLLIVYDADADTGQDSPMKVFRVFIAPAVDATAPMIPTEDDLPVGL